MGIVSRRSSVPPVRSRKVATDVTGYVTPDQRHERRLEVLAIRARQQTRGGGVCQDPPVAHEQKPLTTLGLVHDVARDEQGRPGGREPVEERPQAPAQ